MYNRSIHKISDFDVLGISAGHSGEKIDYGVRMSGSPLEWEETMGEGIKVGIIDTGVDLTHPDLRGRIKASKNFIGGESAQDDNGHGTHVAGIIAAEKNGLGVVGVAPKADLYIAKAFNKEGTSQGDAISRSMSWLLSENVDVINMSFSSNTPENEYYGRIKEAYNRGVMMLCAAGNEGRDQSGRDEVGYPAHYDETMAVAAVDIQKERADFSSQGAKVEIAAAGKDIYSTYLNGGYATLSGTSMATPIIAGCTALLQAKAKTRYNRKLSPDELRLVMQMYTEDLGIRGPDSSYGYGLFTFGRLAGTDYVSVAPAKSNALLNFFKPSGSEIKQDSPFEVSDFILYGIIAATMFLPNMGKKN